MALAGHVLTATDAALKAFLESVGVTATILRGKESAEIATTTHVVCFATSAKRERARNWTVTGSVDVRTPPLDDGNADNLAASTALEAQILDAFEDLTPFDDQPAQLADAITVAANDPTAYSLLQFSIQTVDQGFDEDGYFTFAINYTAAVVA